MTIKNKILTGIAALILAGLIEDFEHDINNSNPNGRESKYFVENCSKSLERKRTQLSSIPQPEGFISWLLYVLGKSEGYYLRFSTSGVRTYF